MQKLINKQTGELVPVSHDELPASLQSGQYSMPGDQPIALKGPDGELVQIDPQFVYPAVTQGGYSFPSEQEYTQVLNEVKYGDGAANKAKALVYGAIEGVPFAGGHILSNIAPKEEVEGIKSAHPVLNAIGQIGTAAAGIMLAPQAEGVAAAKAALEAATKAGNVEAMALAAKNLAQAQSAFTGLDVLNPVSAISKAGGKAAALVPEGLTATSKALSKVGQAATRGAVEGSLFTAGQLANEYTLGDPNFNGENLVHNIGIGAVLGGVFGGALESGILASKGVASKLWGKAEDAASKEIVHASAQNAASKLDEVAGVEIGNGLVDDATTEMTRVAEAMKNPNIIVDPPIHASQIDQFSSPADKQIYQALRESPEGVKIIEMEQRQKKSMLQSIHNIVDSISETKVSKDLKEAGAKIADTFDNIYEATKAEIKPLWKKMDELGGMTLSHPGAVIDYLEKALPGISDSLDFDGISGKIKLSGFDPAGNWKRETHRALKDIVTAINREDLTFGNIANLRSHLYDASSKMTLGKEARAELRQVRKELLNFMQDLASEKGLITNEEIRDGLRKYAKNEEFADVVEYILGGKLGSKDLKTQIVPEGALDKLFSDSVTVAKVKEVLGEKQFNSVLKEYMSHKINSFYDPDSLAFSSKQLQKFLNDAKGKGIELTEAFGNNQGKLKDLRDYNALMRNIPDAPSSNPSHSARQISYNNRLEGISETVGLLATPKIELVKMALSAVGKKFGQRADELVNQRTAENILKGMSPGEARREAEGIVTRFRVLNKIEQARDVTNKKIESGVKKILTGAEVAKRGSPKVAELIVSNSDRGQKIAVKDEYEDKSKKVRIMAQNADATMTGLSDATEALNQFAPQTALSFQTTIAKGVQFLDSKIPSSNDVYPMGSKIEPSKSEMVKFLNFYDMVENPLKVMDKIQFGLLTPDDMEVMTQVHSETYHKIQKQLIMSMNGQKVPYQTKMMLTLFMGQPMDGSLTQESILTNQIALQGPSQQSMDNKVKPTQKGLDSLDVAGRLLTPMQKSARRVE